VAVRSFIDSSGIAKDPFLSLAAFSADDRTWAEFETGWQEILESGLWPVPYFHMVEAVGRQPRTPFCHLDGWTREQVWGLILKLADYMKSFSGGRITMHSCRVDMNAWRKLTGQGIVIPTAVDLCSEGALATIIKLFGNKIWRETTSWPRYMGRGELLNFVFDRNEAFIAPFSKKVNEGKDKSEASGEFSLWQLIDSITEGEMKTSPGLQAADILAWGLNRQNTVAEGKQGKHLAHILHQLVMCTSKDYDENALRREFANVASKQFHEKA
jgi:uncharacterized protein DUF3800